MNKIRLKLDHLAVESFGTAAGEEKMVGTVAGHAITLGPACQTTVYPQCYPSQNCSLNGPYQLTCAPDCMTNERGYC